MLLVQDHRCGRKEGAAHSSERQTLWKDGALPPIDQEQSAVGTAGGQDLFWLGRRGEEEAAEEGLANAMGRRNSR